MFGAFEFHWTSDFILRFLTITIIDLALSGDNAIVIGMAAASLPRERRKWAIVFGGGLAIVLRITLCAIATLLMRIPLVSAIGGCVLFWIAWKLLRMNVSEAGNEQEKKAKQAKNFRQAIILILMADLMMSLDNVIAIAGTAHGEVTLIIIGLLISMPLLMVAGGAVSLLIDKFKWLIFVGAAVIIFAGTRMIFEDKLIAPNFPVPTAIVLAVSVLIGIGVTALFVWTNRRKARLLAAKTATAATNNPGKNGGRG